ncbi:MAG: hypothetical protein RL518_392 [Pseudomonadota bacterium]|jgi:ABC-type branched-subunit amino acid transport system substrate-binding protein
MTHRISKFLLTVVISLSIHLGGVLADNRSINQTEIGVSTALTGNMAPFGVDIKNALILANDLYGRGRYHLTFEDDQCDNRQAVGIAHKFSDLDGIKYILGHACNGTLIASIPIYRRAGSLVLSSFATTGDIRDVGDKSFRLFPPDQIGAVRLFDYVLGRFKKIAFFTSQDDYTELMERWFRKTVEDRHSSISIVSDSLRRGESDFRSVLGRLKNSEPDLVVLNVNGETDFITAVKQARAIGIKCPLTGFYLPASEATMKALGSMIEGMEFINLPLLENTLSSEGKRVFDEFHRRFGAPQSIQLGVALTVDTFRILDLALSSGMPPEQYLRSRTHDSLIGPISFDETGEVKGIPFQVQKIESGKVVVLEKQ